ncbi:uncharacterized protein ACWYII_022690 [Salvelinus alpinus]
MYSNRTAPWSTPLNGRDKKGAEQNLQMGLFSPTTLCVAVLSSFSFLFQSLHWRETRNNLLEDMDDEGNAFKQNQPLEPLEVMAAELTLPLETEWKEEGMDKIQIILLQVLPDCGDMGCS